MLNSIKQQELGYLLFLDYIYIKFDRICHTTADWPTIHRLESIVMLFLTLIRYRDPPAY
jgi:hypothetical protein